MKQINRSLIAILTIVFTLSLTGCSPEVGSEKWCSQIKDQPKGDWTANEAGDFAKHCIF
ncbi:MAG: DUF3012 domain-containing protein [Methylophagaceae bacterium]